MAYYIYKNNERSGPFDEADVVERLRNGDLSPDDLCCTERTKDWEPLRVLLPLAVPDYVKASIEGIPTHLPGSLISLVFCLIPGIVAVVYALETRNAKKRFDADRAEFSGRRAKGWMVAAYVIGGVLLAFRLLGSR